MKFPAKVEYALRAVTELAGAVDRTALVRMKEISKRQQIPENFLVQILLRLKNAGIVRSIRGVHGGYCLERERERISVAEVIRAVDQTLIEPPVNDRLPKDTTGEFYYGLFKECNDMLVTKLEGLSFAAVSKELHTREMVYHI